MAHPNLNNADPELLNPKTKTDEIKKLKTRTEKHDYNNTVESPKIDEGYFI